MEDADRRRLFVDRTHHRPLVVEPADRARGSYVGARPPRGVVAQKPRCPACGGGLMHQFTLGGDALGDEMCEGRTITMLCCRDIACRMKTRGLVTPSAIVFVVHDESERAAEPTEWDGPAEGRGLALGPTTLDEHPETRVIPTLAKIGGRPGYINNWGEKQQASAEEGGRALLVQWSEEIYPRKMKAGPQPFLFGVVYVWTRVNPATKVPGLADALAFWQNT